jgi:hypothetical protein
VLVALLSLLVAQQGNGASIDATTGVVLGGGVVIGFAVVLIRTANRKESGWQEQMEGWSRIVAAAEKRAEAAETAKQSAERREFETEQRLRTAEAEINRLRLELANREDKK